MALADLDDAALDHLVVEVVALSRSFPDAREDTVAAVVRRDVVDQLHDHDRLAHARAAEQTDLAALGVRGQQIDDLDARGQDLLGLALLHEGGRGAVDGELLLRLHNARVVHGVPDHVHDASQALGADGDRDGGARVHDLLAAHHALRGTEFVVVLHKQLLALTSKRSRSITFPKAEQKSRTKSCL